MGIANKNRELNTRFLFVFTGAFMLYEGFQNWLRGRIFENPGIVIVHIVTYLIAFSLLFLALVGDDRIRWIEGYPLVALIFTAFYSVYVISEIVYTGVYRTDAIAFSHYSAMRFVEDFKNGVLFNPYTADLQDALRIFSVEVDYMTFTKEGDIITYFNYPALHFLNLVPFVYLGWRDVRWVILLFEVASIIIIYVKAPSDLRPLIIIPLFAGSDLAINFTAGCVTDFLWVLPMILTAFYLERNLYLGGAFYGISCATKQIPWIIAPFLLIWIWRSIRETYFKRILGVASFIAISTLGFILPNLYFMRQNFEAWKGGVLTPIFGNLVFLSQGFSLFTQTDIFKVQKEFYLVAMTCLFATLLLNYFVYFDKLKYTVWIYPGLIMWASYRGLQNYFISWIPLLTTSIVLWYNEERKSRETVN